MIRVKSIFFIFLLCVHLYAYLIWLDFRSIAFAFLFVSLVCSFFILFLGGCRFGYFYIFSLLVLLVYVFFVPFFIGGTLSVFYSVVQLFVALLIYNASKVIAENDGHVLDCLLFFAMTNIALLFGFWFFSGASLFKPWVLTALNPNILGFFVFLNLFVLVAFLFMGRGRAARFFSAVFVVAAVFLILVSGARSTLGALVISVIFYALLRLFNIKVNKRVVVSSIFFVFLVSPAFAYFYVFLSAGIYADELNFAFGEITGKNLFTGREVIWKAVISSIGDNLLFGRGFGSSMGLLDLDVSAHNLYLTLLYQLGVVGYFLFFVVVSLALGNLSAGSASNRFQALCFSLLMVVLFQQNFEIFLFQNNLPASFLFWVCLALSNRKMQSPNKLG